jgi:hypothetical protein
LDAANQSLEKRASRLLSPIALDAAEAWNYPVVVNMDAHHFPVWLGVLIPVLILVALWDGVWKVIGMWKSASNNQLAWFICIAIFSTAGILPIILCSVVPEGPQPTLSFARRIGTTPGLLKTPFTVGDEVAISNLLGL